MSFIFYEPFEPALYVRRRPAGQARSPAAGAVTSFNPARRRIADAFFEEEPLLQRRRPRPPGFIPPPPPGSPSFSATRRLMATLAAFAEDPWPDGPRHFGGAGFTLPDGTSASFTLGFIGQGDDPYTDEALGAGAATGLGADPSQALASRQGGDFTGVSASRSA